MRHIFIYKTDVQNKASIVLSKYFDYEFVKCKLYKKNIYLNLIYITLFEYKSVSYFIPYFGFGFKGLPIIELYLNIISLIMFKKIAINYYGDGFLQRGRVKHVINQKTRKLIYKFFNYMGCILNEYFIFENGFDDDSLIKYPLDYRRSREIMCNSFYHEDIITNNLSVVPLFNFDNKSFFTMGVPAELISDTIFEFYNLNPDSLLVVINHPLCAKEKFDDIIKILFSKYGLSVSIYENFPTFICSCINCKISILISSIGVKNLTDMFNCGNFNIIKITEMDIFNIWKKFFTQERLDYLNDI